MKRNIFKIMLASTLFVTTMSIMACSHSSQEQAEATDSIPKVDVKVVLATSDNGLTIYQSPSKSAMKLCPCTIAGGTIYDWAEELEIFDESEAIRNALVIGEEDGWYKVAHEGNMSEYVAGYISKDECKEAKAVPITEEWIKEQLGEEGFQQNVDGTTYYLSSISADEWFGLSDPCPHIIIDKIEGGKMLRKYIPYKISTSANRITFFWNEYNPQTQKVIDKKVEFTNPLYCKNGGQYKLTPKDLKELLATHGNVWPIVRVQLDGDEGLFEFNSEAVKELE